jgi:GrpB-like predicted nucleotidyltransferase (UPF0157 family)
VDNDHDAMTRMKPVVVVDYDPNWPSVFDQLRSHIWPEVSDIALSVEHIGSTAVPGLRAKPVIDVCVVVASKELIPPAIERIQRLGYVHRGTLGVPDREAFRRPDHLPRHHLYLSPANALSLRNQIGFRDYLRTHPDVARQYGDLKTELARRYPDDIDLYIDGKTEFVLGILRTIGMTDAELSEIRDINQIEKLRNPPSA